ncbi:YbhB/YbcL family Raf kinase inhibitor-like protein [Micrococcaceae bacterium Sec5.7]
MELLSTSFDYGQEIPQRYGKKIENVSPQLFWEGVPRQTKSFALSLVDNHPVARKYVHWLVVDIGADVTMLAKGAAGRGLLGGGREVEAYAGPFPPSGTHEYEFTLYALGVETLDLPAKATLDRFVQATEGDVLAAATLLGTFTKA